MGSEPLNVRNWIIFACSCPWTPTSGFGKQAPTLGLWKQFMSGCFPLFASDTDWVGVTTTCGSIMSSLFVQLLFIAKWVGKSPSYNWAFVAMLVHQAYLTVGNCKVQCQKRDVPSQACAAYMF